MSEDETEISHREFAFRIAWIGIRLLFVAWLAESGQAFIYQGF